MRADIFLFIGILLFLFFVWIAVGGPSHPISFAGPYITPLAPGVDAQGYSLSEGPAESQSASNSATSRTIKEAQENIIDLENALTSAARFGNPSPYEGEVTIRHSVGSLGANNPDDEYLTISAASDAPSGIDITGWRIESEAVGYSLKISEGVNLPHTGTVNAEAPIVLEPGERALIVTGSSPVGYSFRENMCTGYFDQFQSFTPDLDHECPDPIDDFNRFYYGNEHSLDACKAYIEDLDSCTLPLEPPSGLASDCYTFIDTYLNYNGCVAAHQGDPDFYSTEWRIYLGQEQSFFTKDHDTIKLLDTDGNTVDLISY